MLSPVTRRWHKLQRHRTTAAAILTGGDSGPAPELLHVLQQPLPDPSTPLTQLDFLAIDLETSGLDAQRDEIISVGWVPISNGRIQLTGSAHWLVAAAQSGGPSAGIHGIRDCDRHQGIPLNTVLAHLYTALHQRWPVFHHAALDLGFLNRACHQHWHTTWPTLYVDTLRWQRRRQQRAESAGQLNLSRVMEHHQLPTRTAHNALDDALSCAEVFIALIAQYRACIGDVGGVFV